MVDKVDFSLEPTLSALDPDTSFMATVAAFNCLNQPQASDVERIDHLLTSVYARISDKTKQEAAIKLNGWSTLPSQIAALLCVEPLDIASPVLSALAPLSDKTLLKAIARHGSSHLNVIAKRPDLSASLQALCSRKNRFSTPEQALDTTRAPSISSAIDTKRAPSISSAIDTKRAPSISSALANLTAQGKYAREVLTPPPLSPSQAMSPKKTTPAPEATKRVEINKDMGSLAVGNLRESLRALIENPINTDKTQSEALPKSIFMGNMNALTSPEQLVQYAVEKQIGLLATKISDQLALDYSHVKRLIIRPSYTDLLTCLRAMHCDAVVAFAVCAPFCKEALLSGDGAIALFYERAHAITPADAQNRLMAWRAPTTSYAPANNAEGVATPYSSTA